MSDLSIDIGGRAVHAVRQNPQQPTGGFVQVEDAVRWQQHQLWWDPQMSVDTPRAGSLVSRGSDGIRLWRLDDSLRVASPATDAVGGALELKQSVAGFTSSDPRVLAVVDGMGVELVRDAPVMEGAPMPIRKGLARLVSMEGVPLAIPETEIFRDVESALRLPSLKSVAIGAALAAGVLVSAVAINQVRSDH